ncbi:hypothetical protein TorRG33x02_305890 [Trema orientale]|uniref:Uncharacterized protein n=1 Tax=Trema orientale TaxID=63057 RepID=A0A2P5BWW9_TREOI|nr:hypothetical protein TorRG33x02_305890 [Trema orientale]
MRMVKQSLYRRVRELDALEGSWNWNDLLKQERHDLKCEVEEIIFKEVRTLRMKSKFTWAKEGDANTKLFHSLMNARKSKNSITRLEMDDGSFVDREEDIVKVVTEFYCSLYKSAELEYRGIKGVDWSPLSVQIKDWLERPFEEELKRTVFESDGNKSQGSDEFTMVVF